MGSRLSLKKQLENILQRKLKKIIADSTDKKTLQEIAEYTEALVKARVTKGYGVVKRGESEYKFKPLSKGYKKYRKEFKDLSPDTTPNKSNLHLTGDMVNSIKGSVKPGKVIVNCTEEFNLKKAEWNEKTRPFLELSRQELKKIKAYFSEKIKNILKKYIKSNS